MKASGERRRRRSSGFVKYGRDRTMNGWDVDGRPESYLDREGLEGGGDWRTFVYIVLRAASMVPSSVSRNPEQVK